MTDKEIVDACIAAGFVTENRIVRKVLGTLPISGDGYIIGDEAELWKCTSFPRKESSIIKIKAHLIHIGEYDGFDFVDFKESFASKEAALIAGLAYNEYIRNMQ